jgi:hypothetical protein
VTVLICHSLFIARLLLNRDGVRPVFNVITRTNTLDLEYWHRRVTGLGLS